jgi:hypothetical protein
VVADVGPYDIDVLTPIRKLFLLIVPFNTVVPDAITFGIIINIIENKKPHLKGWD